VLYELQVVSTSLDDSINHRGTPNPVTNSLPPTSILDARFPPLPLENDAYDTMHDDDMHVVSFEHNEIAGDTIRAGPDHDMIEPLVCEFVVPGDPRRDLAQEMDEKKGSTIQGEYIPATYFPATISYLMVPTTTT